MSVFVPVLYCLDDYSFVIQPEVLHCDVTDFGFFFNIPPAIQGLFWFHTNLRIVCSLKNAVCIAINV